jgi:hypothetical protein
VMMPALAWSETDDKSRVMPAVGGSGYTSARPALNFEAHERARPEKKTPIVPWQRLPGLVVIGTAVAVLLVGIAVAIGFSDEKPAVTPAPNVSTPAAPLPASGGTPQSAPTNQAPPAASPAPPAQQAPPPVDAGPPAADTPEAVPQVDAPAPPAAPPPPPVPQAPPMPQAPPIPPAIPQVPQLPAIPPIPHIPDSG